MINICTIIAMVIGLTIGVIIARPDCLRNVLNTSFSKKIMNKTIVAILDSQNIKENIVTDYAISYGSSEIISIISSLGLEPVILNYRDLIDADFIFKKNNCNPERIEDVVFNIVRNYLKEQNIKKVIIPGDYYELQREPRHPTPNRQLCVQALEKLASMGEIHLMGICGGLQGIVHAKGIDLVRVKDIADNVQAKKHAALLPDFNVNAEMNITLIDPQSRLGSIVMEATNKQPIEGYLNVFILDGHTTAISNDPLNLQKLSDAGYTAVSKCDDGIIEAIEDKHGNIHFEHHPEAFLFKQRQRTTMCEEYNDGKDISHAIFKEFALRKFQTIN